MSPQRTLLTTTLAAVALAATGIACLGFLAFNRKQAEAGAVTSERKSAKIPPQEIPVNPEPRKIASKHERIEDVIYGRREGMALTMDIFAPKGERNGAGVIVCVTSEYKSNRELMALISPYVSVFVDRGYVVYAVMHSSHPQFTVADAVEDMHRAVRFIKTGAGKYGVDPDRLGIAGMSAGGQLALMMGCAGKVGDPKAGDPVEKASSQVAAVACFFPPTDFNALDEERLKEFLASFDFREYDAKLGKLVPVSPEKRKAIADNLSPVNHVTNSAAPTFIMHGTFDKTVPIAQSERMIRKLEECGVECKLAVKENGGHLWWGIEKDIPFCADWFDRQLLGKK